MEDDPLSLFVREDLVVKKNMEDKLKVDKVRKNMERLGFDDDDDVSSTEATVPSVISSKNDDINVRSPDVQPERLTVKQKLPQANRREEDEIVERETSLLSGERSLMHLTDAKMFGVTSRMISGTLDMTNFRLIFIPNQVNSSALSTRIQSIISHMTIPLACIDHLEKDKRPKDGNFGHIGIFCKDARCVHLVVPGLEADRIMQAITAYAFPNSTEYLFAFSHSPLPSFAQSGWNMFDLSKEFDRQGIFRDRQSGTKSPWRLSVANEAYTLCESYPSLLVVPREITDRDLFQVSYFRAGGRLPALTWGSNSDSASIWRSSQPKVGVSSNNNETDERFLDYLSRYSSSSRQAASQPVLHIIDCRPKSNAMANRATGHGYEIQANYPNSHLEFYNICNIHAMRESCSKLVAMSLSSGADDVSWNSALEDSKWLSHIRAILSASHKTAQLIHKDRSAVLIHCSHGWDRTSQVVCLAQLMLDSYYRTFKGFQMLVEKDWLAFGHPFQLRCAHGSDKTVRDDDQMCPVFIQFLDCVWQLINLFPQHFEYNSRFLLALSDQVYSCRFGSFLCNCQSERLKLSSKCPSVWAYMDMNRQTLTNPLYIPSSAAASSPSVFIPGYNELMRGVSLWADYHLRWSSLQSNPQIPHNLKPYICGQNHPVGPLITNREDLEIFESSCKHNIADLYLPAYFSSSDHWEAYFWKERGQKETLQRLLVSIANSLDSIVSLRKGDCSNMSESTAAATDCEFPASNIVDLLLDIQKVSSSVPSNSDSRSLPMNWILSLLRSHSFPQILSPSLPSTSSIAFQNLKPVDKKYDSDAIDVSESPATVDESLASPLTRPKTTGGFMTSATEIISGALRVVPAVTSATAEFIVESIIGPEADRFKNANGDNDYVVGEDEDDWLSIERVEAHNSDDADSLDAAGSSRKPASISSLIDNHVSSNLFSSKSIKSQKSQPSKGLFEDPLNPFN